MHAQPAYDTLIATTLNANGKLTRPSALASTNVPADIKRRTIQIRAIRGLSTQPATDAPNAFCLDDLTILATPKSVKARWKKPKPAPNCGPLIPTP